MKGKEAYDKIFDKLTYDQQQELGDQVLRTVYQDLLRLEKLKKVIEILKRNYLAIEKNRNSDTGYIVSIESDITQQEYELLKEVLQGE